MTATKQVLVPLFDWRDFLAQADAIIASVAKEKTRARADKRNAKGCDLSAKRDSIAQLLVECAELFIVAGNDYELRNAMDKPSKREKRNWEPNVTLGPEHDYGDFPPLLGDETWDEFWKSTYGRPRGNPGVSKLPGPPTAPVRGVYNLVRKWWRSNRLGRFSATFDSVSTDGFNSPSRFLLGVLQCMDKNYTADNAKGLWETNRKVSTAYRATRKKAVQS
jgi:hypothetical protein